MNKHLIVALFALAAALGGVLLKRDRDSLQFEIAEARSEVARLQQQAQQAAQALQARDELDKQRFKEMTDAKHEIDGLRDQLAAGTKRVLVRATCPAVQPSTGTTGVDDAREPTLTADARQDYLRIREQIVTTEAQLAGLQEYVRQVVQVAK
ncbi:lysis protein [Pseudomonas plecoglossicida]|uniref:lysis protein n=1 Tax=Pseudomonas putida group TaxID=136845 RepID=UPI00240FF067|nr:MULTISPECIES: lysis protein [Pseudomonas putida group]MDQ7967110.1 lysis protein [Pseudomonas plecoglossicida]WFG05298.1 lysis protein [Pseudomonas putida]